MKRINLSKSRLAAAIVLIAVLVVGILFPVSGSGAKYATQTSVRGSVSYMMDTSLATGLYVTDTDTYKLIPGTTVAPGAKVTVSGKTTLPSYLYVVITGMYAPALTDDWTLLEGVVGPNNGKVYLYGNDVLADNVTDVNVFKSFTLGEMPVTAGGDAFVSAYLVEKYEGETPAASFEARADRTSTILKSATEHFKAVEVTATVSDDYKVTNTGDIDAYIRAKVVLNHVDEAKNIDIADDPIFKESDRTALSVPSGWTQVGEYLYWNDPVAPNGTTDPALDPTEVADGVQITVIAEAIQAEGGAAADVWTEVTKTADGWAEVTP